MSFSSWSLSLSWLLVVVFDSFSNIVDVEDGSSIGVILPVDMVVSNLV